MARPLRIEYHDAFYHVFSRGNEKRIIFKQDSDYQLFLTTLKESANHFDVRVHSYCLMRNHFHLLIETKKPNLSKFMQRLLGVYTIRFNKIHNRQGHLFQGRYKALLIDKDTYLLALTRYIHLNPCKAKLVENPEDYAWSSMRYFLEKEKNAFPHKEFILSQFKTAKSYRQFIMEGLTLDENPLLKSVGGTLLGPAEFVERFKDEMKQKKEQDFSGKRELFKSSPEKLREFLKDKDRNFKIYCFWKIAKITQKEINESGIFWQEVPSDLNPSVPIKKTSGILIIVKVVAN